MRKAINKIVLDIFDSYPDHYSYRPRMLTEDHAWIDKA